MHHPFNVLVDLRTSLVLQPVKNASPEQKQAAVNALARDLPRAAVQRALQRLCSDSEAKTLLDAAYGA